VLDRDYRAGFLASATLDAVIDVRGRCLPVDDLINIGGTHGYALAYALAFVVVYLDYYTELLALPLPDICHRGPLVFGLEAAVLTLVLSPKQAH
jgi:hypothetical protein